MSLFLCMCPQCYPLVMTGNKIKNRILYEQQPPHHHHDHHQQQQTDQHLKLRDIPPSSSQSSGSTHHHHHHNRHHHHHDYFYYSNSPKTRINLQMTPMTPEEEDDENGNDRGNNDDQSVSHDHDHDHDQGEEVERIIIDMSTDAYFGGLPLQFEEQYPEELFFASIPKEELSENQKLRSLEEDDNDHLNEDDGIEDEIAHDDQDINRHSSHPYKKAKAQRPSKKKTHKKRRRTTTNNQTRAEEDQGRIPLIHPDDFYVTMLNINGVIQKNVPCVGKVATLALLGLCTCGLTWIPLWTAGSRTVQALEQFLRNENEKVYDVKYGAGNVEWRLHTDLYTAGVAPCSWIEIRIKTRSLRERLLQQQQQVQEQKQIEQQRGELME